MSNCLIACVSSCTCFEAHSVWTFLVGNLHSVYVFATHAQFKAFTIPVSACPGLRGMAAVSKCQEQAVTTEHLNSYLVTPDLQWILSSRANTH